MATQRERLNELRALKAQQTQVNQVVPQQPQANQRQRLEQLRALKQQQLTQQPIQEGITPDVIDTDISGDRALPLDSEKLRQLEQAQPTEAERALAPTTLEQLLPPIQKEPDFQLEGILEPAAQIATGILAEPVAGISGLVVTALRDAQAGAETVEAVKKALTFETKSRAGKRTLSALGEVIEPIGKFAGKVETTLGNATLEATGSPELATIAHSLPTAVLTILGVKGLKGPKFANQKLSSNVSEAITQAAPDLKTIKTQATNAYKELDNLGIRVKPKVFENFANKLSGKLKREGIDPILHPKSTAAIGRIVDDIGQAKKPSELETLRKIAKDAASSIDPSDARLGTIIVREIDDSLDKLSTQIGGQFKEARALSQRAFKSQTITDMIENASHTASGMENGLRIEARKLLKNKKKRRGFTRDELNALREIEQGTTAANMAKFLGKFGISEGQATSMLGASIGIGGGGAIGAAFGPGGAAIGALTVPALGQFAKNTARKITLNNTKFADDLVRAGKSAKEVTKTYLKHTPIADRNISDLTDLFLDTTLTSVDIRALPSSKSAVGKLATDAVHFANEIKIRAKQAGAIGLITQPELVKEEEQ